MSLRFLRAAALVCVGALLFGVAAPAHAAQPGPVPGDVIRAWNQIAVSQPFGNAVRLSRVLAIVHAAQYDAINSVEPRYTRYVAHFLDPSANIEAAAAHTALLALFPENRAALDAELEQSLEGIADGPAKVAGIELGRAAASAVADYRASDGFTTSDEYAPPPAPGVWQPTPPAFAPMVEPQFRTVRPFTLIEPSQFLAGPPPSLSSAEYARDFNEVKLVGQDTSRVRTADQTHLAHFWFEPSPAGWSRVAGLVSAQQGYDVHETARLFALVYMAMADGFIVGWHQKTRFGLWRPVTAVRAADTDGNQATEADPMWMSLRPTPAAPDYPSTHSVLGSAAAEVLRQFTGTDAFEFCMASSSSTPQSTERCWHSFTEAELENAESRVLVGIHFGLHAKRA
jgi:hypothetical protein